MHRSQAKRMEKQQIQDRDCAAGDHAHWKHSNAEVPGVNCDTKCIKYRDNKTSMRTLTYYT